MKPFFTKALLALFSIWFTNADAQNAGFSAVLAFGDSILDTGNNNLLMTVSKCNFFPYGRDFPGHRPTGRFGNGRVVSDLVAEGLGIKTLLPAFRNPLLSSNELPTGVCFASGGSGIDKVTASIQGVIWVPDQLRDFQRYIERLNSAVGDPQKANEIISNAVFLISAGNNDLAITYFSTPARMTRYTISRYTDMLIEWTTTFLKNLYDLGARKFAVLGTLPLGCLPGAKRMTGGMLCLPNVNYGAKMFNNKLSNLVNQLNENLPDAKFVYVDMYTYLMELVENPAKNGFLTAAKSCCCMVASPVPCLDASRYVFWDFGHPTQKAYETILPNILNDIRSLS
ncbi:PREDICTED: GDSL esterase/lipase At5g63170-like [Tarenaya hassleriana]|uniref:GDSL esterase/lipase At5g63170-like n=1 Tax=Tarenaya hassleriana TaxID=28532 RepID=UPI00053C7EE4|nr:PREDICTED: GDSL esterase/lipase At5g63170-like [Tarenaya hassleriana]